MRKSLLLICMLGFSTLSAQKIAPATYWVYFTDKSGNGYETGRPEAFLSARSIDRRAWQGLPVDVTDLPVTDSYVRELRNRGLEVVHVSRWLNGAAVRTSDTAILQKLYPEPYFDSVQWIPPDPAIYFPGHPGSPRFENRADQPPVFDYGFSREQTEMIGIQVLHQKGYTGRGVHVAVLDAGFMNVDSVPSFTGMIAEGRLFDTLNLVNDENIFRITSMHGMNVLSIMGAEWNGNLVGTAPHATYLLCMTENPYREYPIEEIAWIAAAERADSLGFDVINTSLGYSTFDDSTMNYSYPDMDGRSTFISRAASMLAGKGMILSNSAGNSGYTSWHYITAPADAIDILAVGAVDSLGQITRFSSRGPTYDHRIKPDVSAMGSATAVQNTNGRPARGSGTSFSSPVIAGAVASLWQAYPSMPAGELIRAVLQSANREGTPDIHYGYGIPNFALAYFAISSLPANMAPAGLEIYPNPARHRIMIKMPEPAAGFYRLEYYDIHGRLSARQEVYLPGEVDLPGTLIPGIYILRIKTERGIYRTRLIINE